MLALLDIERCHIVRFDFSELLWEMQFFFWIILNAVFATLFLRF